jgi:formyl-CoA transferase
MSGTMSVTGLPDGPPLKAGPAVCDFNAGVHLYGGIVTALLRRERTGRGGIVEVAMMEASYFPLSSNLGMMYADPNATARTGNRHGGMALCPYNVYPAKDGYIAIIVNQEKQWKALVSAFGHAELGEDPRYLTNVDRVSRMEEVDDFVSRWTQDLMREEIFTRLIARRVPCGPVRDLSEVMNDPHLHARRALRWIEHPQYGRIVAAASPLRFDGEAVLPEPPSVPLGTHSRAVLHEKLELSDLELDSLEAAGVI